MRPSEMSIGDIATLLESRDLTASACLADLLERASRLNEKLNAFCFIDQEGAYAEAEASDARREQGRAIGSLDGIPIHVKDNIFVRNMPCTWGSKLYENFVPAGDDWVVERLRAAGAVMFAKTNTPELALAATTNNLLFGPSRNPYELNRTPGGSSGGAVVASAARLGPGGIATDAGGSIRRPCGYSGAVGLRTSLGTVLRKPGFPATVNDFQTIGPVAARLADLKAIFGAIRSTRPSDAIPDRNEISIKLILEAGNEHIDPAVESATRDVGKVLTERGYRVDEVPAPWSRAAVEQAFRVMSASGAARIAAVHLEEAWAAQATSAIQALADAGRALSAVEYVRALDTVANARMSIPDWFEDNALWLMPTSPCTAWPIGDDYPTEIAGHRAGLRDASVYGPIVNALGAAGLVLPVARDNDGLPIGIQLVGASGKEDLALFVGQDVLQATGEIEPPLLPDAP